MTIKNMTKIILKHKNDNRIAGYLTFLKTDNKDNKDNDEIVLMYINIEEEYTNKGLGTYLLWSLFDHIVCNDFYKDINYIVWDDCSDRSRKNNNIYINIGARYVNKYGPEMILKIRSRTINLKRKRYNSDLSLIYNIEII